MVKMFVKNEFLVITTLTIALFSIPFLIVDLLPMVDLPNHLSQAHLLGNVLSGNRQDLMVNWLAPNSLTTEILACLLIVFPPLVAAKVMVLGMLILSILGIAALAKKSGASCIVVPLSAAMLLNQSFYWGFLPFIAGFVAFLFLIVTWPSLKQISWQGLITLASLFLLVYFSHILWFAVAMLAAMLIAFFSPRRSVALRAIIFSSLPALTLILLWYPSIRKNWMNAGFDMRPAWLSSFLNRLHPDYVASTISGLISSFNYFILLTVLSFVLIGIGRTILYKYRIVSIPLMALATILLVAYLTLPDVYNNTWLFSVRWLPYALIFFLVGCLAPIQVPKWRIVALLFAFMVLGGCVRLTAFAWGSVEREELSGFLQALEKLPPKQAVLGLDFIVNSTRVNNDHIYSANAAYAQVIKDCEVNFSFADHASSLVTGEF